MENNQDKKPILVTGATGYVAGWIVKNLLDRGETVHAAVRDPNNNKKLNHLNAIAEKSPGEIRYFKSDLLERGSYDEAMKGCEIVLHTASPFTTSVDDPQRDLVDPAVLGTENVLESANRVESVKRVVVTSSCAAIYTDAIDCAEAPGGVITENEWNTTASLEYQPYSYSKVLAEKKAWEMANGQRRWELVTINPSLVMGPPLNTKSISSESFNILKQIGDGTFKYGAPKMGIGMVDVRDVAEAHYRAAFWPNAKGRYITSGHNTNLLEMAMTLREKYGKDYPVPASAMPKWLLMIIGPMVNKSLSRRFIKNNVDVEFRADNSKIKNQLEMSFRPIQETMEDSFDVLIKNEVFKKK